METQTKPKKIHIEKSIENLRDDVKFLYFICTKMASKINAIHERLKTLEIAHNKFN